MPATPRPLALRHMLSAVQVRVWAESVIVAGISDTFDPSWSASFPATPAMVLAGWGRMYMKFAHVQQTIQR